MNKRDLAKLKIHSVYPIVKDTIRDKKLKEDKEQQKLRERYAR